MPGEITADREIHDARINMGQPEEDSVFRRMPAGSYPEMARSHKVLIVELKGDDRNTPTGGLPDDQCAILTPTKVPMPDLTAWVEKGYSLTALGVGTVCLHPFVAVAQRTSQSKVFFRGWATGSLAPRA